MSQFSDRFFVVVTENMKQAAAEPDPRARDRQMAAVAANILTRLAGSDSLDHDDKEQAAMLAVRLIVNLQLDLFQTH